MITKTKPEDKSSLTTKTTLADASPLIQYIQKGDPIPADHAKTIVLYPGKTPLAIRIRKELSRVIAKGTIPCYKVESPIKDSKGRIIGTQLSHPYVHKDIAAAYVEEFLARAAEKESKAIISDDSQPELPFGSPPISSPDVVPEVVPACERIEMVDNQEIPRAVAYSDLGINDPATTPEIRLLERIAVGVEALLETMTGELTKLLAKALTQLPVNAPDAPKDASAVEASGPAEK